MRTVCVLIHTISVLHVEQSGLGVDCGMGHKNPHRCRTVPETHSRGARSRTRAAIGTTAANANGPSVELRAIKLVGR